MKFVNRCFAVVILLVPALPAQAQQDGRMVELLQQLSRLESEVRQLRGEVERLGYENQRLKNQQNDLYLDLDRRMQSLETGQSSSGQSGVTTLTPSPLPAGAVNPDAPAVTMTPQTSAIAVQPISPPATASPEASTMIAPQLQSADPAKEQEAYKAAFNLLKVGKYDEAIVAYTDFMQKYSAGQYAANAQYWLGEAKYVTRQFPGAIEEFRKVVSTYPDSRKLPDAMLKIGYIHYEMKQMPEARQMLSDLIGKYPGTTAARLAENRLQRMKLEGH